MVVESEQAIHWPTALRALEPSSSVQRARVIDAERKQRLEWHAAELLSALGLDLQTESTVDTPRRFIDALIEATSGYEGDEKLLTAFPTECHGGTSCELAQIVEGPIPFHALCEHHAMPFFGRAWIGYVAHERIIGISKLTRLVRVVTRRFGVQERMTHQLATSLEGLLDAHGVAVYLEADHLCTQMRGVREPGAQTRTTAWRGAYETDPSLRAEFLSLGAGARSR
jgi:GTP cyclohydrolase I